MTLLSLRGLAAHLNISYESARKYATNKKLYPAFPKKKKCEHCNGVGEGYDQAEIDEWNVDRPGSGGGQYRQDPSAAARTSWETRRANGNAPAPVEPRARTARPQRAAAAPAPPEPDPTTLEYWQERWRDDAPADS